MLPGQSSGKNKISYRQNQEKHRREPFLPLYESPIVKLEGSALICFIFCFCRGNNVARAVLRQKQNILSPNQEKQPERELLQPYESLIVKIRRKRTYMFSIFCFFAVEQCCQGSPPAKTKISYRQTKRNRSEVPSTTTNR